MFADRAMMTLENENTGIRPNENQLLVIFVTYFSHKDSSVYIFVAKKQ